MVIILKTKDKEQQITVFSLSKQYFCTKIHLLKNRKLVLKHNHTFLYFLLISFLWLGMQSLTGCAIMVPPTGGPKDTLSPEFVSAVPKDSMLHFTGNTILLTFNEYVTVDNARENLIASPFQVVQPTVKNKLKTVMITLKDSLQPNTTYSLNFGKSIKDVTEGNPVVNFTYVFSTGDSLDNGDISGTIKLAETGKVDTTLTVILHSNLNDSAIYKMRPDYLAKVDSLGNFYLPYLKPGDYRIYGLEADYNHKYTDSTMLFAFDDSILHVRNDHSIDSIHLLAYREFPREEDNKNAPAPNSKPENKHHLKVEANLDNGTQDLLRPLTLTYSMPIAQFDPQKIVLADTDYHPIDNYQVVADSLDTTHTQFLVKYPWKEEQYFRLLIDTTAALDTLQTRLAKNDTLTFQTKDEADYATVRLKFPDVDLSLHPILQILQGMNMVDSFPIGADRTFYRPLYAPAKYELRILYDVNDDGHWNPGNFEKKIQPEKVILLKQPFDFKVNVENYWDIYLKQQNS